MKKNLKASKKIATKSDAANQDPISRKFDLGLHVKKDGSWFIADCPRCSHRSGAMPRAQAIQWLWTHISKTHKEEVRRED